MNEEYLISNKTHERLKTIVTIVLPIFLVLYISVSNLLNLANALTVCLIIATVMMLGGVFLKFSDRSRDIGQGEYDGEITITGYDEDTGIPDLQLNLMVDPNTFVNGDTIRFKCVDRSV